MSITEQMRDGRADEDLSCLLRTDGGTDHAGVTSLGATFWRRRRRREQRGIGFPRRAADQLPCHLESPWLLRLSQLPSRFEALITATMLGEAGS